MTDDRPRHRVPQWAVVILGILGGVAVTGAVIWFGMWLFTAYDDHGRKIVDVPSAAVIVAFLGLVAGTITAVGTPLVTVLVKRLGDIRHQVQNSHQENLRDDIDGKHDIIVAKLDAFKDMVDGRFDRVEKRIDRAETDIDKLEASDERHHPKERA
jgi:hypothetical protein